MSETTPETAPQSPAAPPEAAAPDFWDKLGGFIRDEVGGVEKRLRAELVHTTTSPASETAAESEEPPEDGAYCNQCDKVSRPGETGDGTRESVVKSLGTAGADLLWAFDHNASLGHHITVWAAKTAFQVAPRIV